MINSYAFGRMEINNRTFSSDLIILPGGRILDNWIRQTGHRLNLDDLSALTDARPELIIAGTGAYGRMDLAPGLTQTLAQMGIEIKAMETAAAVTLYNREFRDAGSPGKAIGACFHLTC